jgi:penicillin-binding protein 2
VVATNPQTGEILAMVSYPDYDNSVFLEPSTNAEAQAEITSLFQDSLSPTMNRATFGLYPPGSAFKLATSLAGLESNSITPGQTLFCSGQTEFDGQVIKCLGIHGNVDMEHALAQSCNSYFTQLGVMTGIANIDKYTKMLGLGEKTGVEISELQGYRNNQETMKLKEKDKYHIWGPADTAQSAIGQLYNLFTPIQLNRYVSAVTTGYITTSHLIYKAMAKDGTMTVDNKIEKTKLDVQESSLQAVRKGMLAVANWGSTNCVSAYSKFPKNFVLAKTGTPETGEEKMGRSSHSIFVCAAPSDDPQIAVSIVIEHGSWGGESAPISADIFNEYFDFNGYTVPQPSSRPDGLSVVG